MKKNCSVFFFQYIIGEAVGWENIPRQDSGNLNAFP